MACGVPPFDLMLITDEGPDLCARVERALEGAPPGRLAVQLRAKQATALYTLQLAQQLRALTRDRGQSLLISHAFLRSRCAAQNACCRAPPDTL
jgi:thiamine monophosphate synthase